MKYMSRGNFRLYLKHYCVWRNQHERLSAGKKVQSDVNPQKRKYSPNMASRQKSKR